MTKQLGFSFDQNICVGCEACRVACQVSHDLDESVNWRKVDKFTITDHGRKRDVFLSHACMHCENPACMKVCPMKCFTKTVDGAVILNNEKCIGCKSCIKACPYGAISTNPSTGKSEKCDLCADMLKMGELPACVQSCPVQALKVIEIGKDDSKLVKEAIGMKQTPTRPSMRFVKPRVLGL